MFRKVNPGTSSRLTSVDHNETYGRHILKDFIQKIEIKNCLDIGCGVGADLSIIKEKLPNANLIGIDFGDWNKILLERLGVNVISVDIEKEQLPFADESLDFVIVNQVLEHTKEIFWINHEIFRVLKRGGFVYVGVPNVLSFHNRVLGLIGIHPTCNKMLSAHVRPFSKNDLKLFYKQIAKDFAVISRFAGSQFYPFPKKISRILSNMFPALSVSIFFLIKKTGPYAGQFISHLEKNVLETNYYKGK